MNLPNATPRRPHEAEPVWERPYVHANILGPSKNVSHRINYTTVAAIITAIIYALGWALTRYE